MNCYVFAASVYEIGIRDRRPSFPVTNSFSSGNCRALAFTFFPPGRSPARWAVVHLAEKNSSGTPVRPFHNGVRCTLHWGGSPASEARASRWRQDAKIRRRFAKAAFRIPYLPALLSVHTFLLHKDSTRIVFVLGATLSVYQIWLFCRLF